MAPLSFCLEIPDGLQKVGCDLMLQKNREGGREGQFLRGRIVCLESGTLSLGDLSHHFRYLGVECEKGGLNGGGNLPLDQPGQGFVGGGRVLPCAFSA